MDTSIKAFFTVEKGLSEELDIPIENISIETPVLTAGNSESTDIKLANQYVSRRQFQIRLDIDVFYISDLESTNGTYLNGIKLEPHVERVLRNGDKVGIGLDMVLLYFTESRNTVTVRTARKDSPLLEETQRPIEPGPLIVDSGSRDVWIRGEKLAPPLTAKEFDILECLFSQLGKAVHRDIVAQAGWPDRPNDVANQEIDQYIKRLRRRIESDPSKPTLIITRRRFGYMIPSP